MHSLTALSPQLIVAAAPPAAPPAFQSLACSAPARTAVIPRAAALQATSLIADSLFRHVIVYDTTARAYRVSADTSGPAGGIRFVLYQVTSYGLPTSPLAPDGWLDLIDQSAGGALQVRSQVSSGATGIGDYVIRVSGTRSADAAGLSGTATDGVHTLSFHDSTTGFPITGTLSTEVTVSAVVSDSLDGFRLDMYAARTTFDPFDYNDTLDFTYASASQTIRMVGAISTYCLSPSINLTIALNGTDYATITNGAAVSYVTLVGGQPATADESQALLDLKDSQRQLFLWLGALFAPAKALLP